MTWTQWSGSGGGGGGASYSLARDEIWLRGGNNWGSTATKIRRFSTVKKNTGTSMTLTQDAANGDSITINATGIYDIAYNDTHTAAANFGVSINASTLTVEIYNLVNVADEMLLYFTAQTASAQAATAGGVWLASGTVVRAHGEALGGTNPHVMFKITRLY